MLNPRSSWPGVTSVRQLGKLCIIGFQMLLLHPTYLDIESRAVSAGGLNSVGQGWDPDFWLSNKSPS